MSMHVIGAGVGRTGTYSLKIAINELGLGPCHHMEAVMQNRPEQIPLWNAAIADNPDWQAIYRDHSSAVDWPTACFFRELAVAYPDAKFVLTERSPASWADSFGATIYKLLSQRESAPPEMRPWFDMCSAVIAKTGFPDGLDRDALMEGFVAHNEAVKATIPKDRLLVYSVRDGWEPLCEFLGVGVPDGDFPNTNNREEFWDLVGQNS